MEIVKMIFCIILVLAYIGNLAFGIYYFNKDNYQKATCYMVFAIFYLLCVLNFPK
jgi:hypothetical protein